MSLGIGCLCKAPKEKERADQGNEGTIQTNVRGKNNLRRWKREFEEAEESKGEQKDMR
jgi:hypothetical protein